MDQNLSAQKWEAKVSTRLERARADQIWPLFEDFFGINKWYPGLPTCHGVQGVNGELGCIRYCSGFKLNLKKNASESDEDSSTIWCKEKLVAIDHEQMTFSYEVVDSNMGFESFVGTVKVVPTDEGGQGCAVEWGFSADPVAGLKVEDLVGLFETTLPVIVRKMEDAIFESS